MSIFRVQDIYIAGEYNIMCWVCGVKMKVSDAQRDYQGHWVCTNDIDEIDRRAQPMANTDIVRAVKDARPEGANVFLPVDIGNWEGVDEVWGSIENEWQDSTDRVF